MSDYGEVDYKPTKSFHRNETVEVAAKEANSFIQDKFVALDREIDGLESWLARLMNRLTPVLGPDQDLPSKPEDREPSREHSSFADQLVQMTTRIDSMNRVISVVVARLEI